MNADAGRSSGERKQRARRKKKSEKDGSIAEVRTALESAQVPCFVTACDGKTVNVLRKSAVMDGGRVSRYVFACKEHTSRYDDIVMGPGWL